MEFKDRLKSNRAEKDLTQQELANIIYVSRSAVAKWESGRGIPNAAALESLAQVFGVSQEDLLPDKERKAFRRGRLVSYATAVCGVIVPVLLLVFSLLPLFEHEWMILTDGIVEIPSVYISPKCVLEWLGWGWSVFVIAVWVAIAVFSLLTAQFGGRAAIVVRNIIIYNLIAVALFMIALLAAVLRAEADAVVYSDGLYSVFRFVLLR